MTYIVCAFESEARALIDAYKLQKEQKSPYPLFTNPEIRLLISGLGQKNAKGAGHYLIERFAPDQGDSFLNIGICAAQEELKVGSLVQIGTLRGESCDYTLMPLQSTITSVSCFSASEAQESPPREDIAEMEALGLYQTLKGAFLPEKMKFLKIVSDNFKPFVPKKQFVISLIQAHIKEIKGEITSLQGESHAL